MLSMQFRQNSPSFILSSFPYPWLSKIHSQFFGKRDWKRPEGGEGEWTAHANATLLITFFFKSHFVHKKYSSFLILRVTLAYGSIGNIKVFSSFLNGLPLLQTFPQKDMLSLPLSESTTLGLENSSHFLIQKVLTVTIDEVTEQGWASFPYLLCASLDVQGFINDMLFRLREKTLSYFFLQSKIIRRYSLNSTIMPASLWA